MKGTRIIALAVACAFLLAAPAFAQSAKKVGFLDLSKLFDNYEKTKEYDKVLEAEHATYEKERNAKIEKLKEAQGKLALLKEDEKKKMEDEIETMRNELVEYDQAQRVDLTKKRDEKIREILLEIEKIVSDYAKKEKFDLILNDRVLIYGNDALNVTDQILTILNDSYNKK